MKRKLRMGMVGGGKDAFIGAIHRIAANSDGLIELVCGALSINKDIAIDSGHSLFLQEKRIYLTYDEMIEKEAALPEDERMDFVTIVTPNFAHFAPAKMALEKGFHVVFRISYFIDNRWPCVSYVWPQEHYDGSICVPYSWNFADYFCGRVFYVTYFHLTHWYR